MPQPPAASQPAPFSTPDPARFRMPKPKRSGRDGVADESGLSDIQTTTPAGATAARPTPRFARSWKRQPTQSQADVRTPAQPAVRKFSVAGSINSGSLSRSGTSSRRFTSGLTTQHRRCHSLGQGRDPFHGGGDAIDAIEDGSSPPQAASQTPQPTVENDEEEEEDGILMVVRESPTAVRTKQPTAASQQLPPLSRPGIFAAGARRRKHRSGLEEDIEDVAPSGGGPGSGDEEDDIVRESGKTVDNAGEDGNEILMPDSGPSSLVITAAAAAAAVATPAPQAHLPLARQQTSAARLLSSIQPLKRRRLFVSPGLITSSPSGAGSDEDDGQREAEDDQYRHPAFIPRFRQQKARHAWDGDEIVDDESSDDGGGGDSDDDGRNEDIRDIVDYGELLEYSQSSDEGASHACRKEDDEMMDHYNDDDNDEEEDEDMILDQTPPRIRRARERQKEKEEQQRQEQRQRMPTFQRARLFMTTRKQVEDGDMDGSGEDVAHNAEPSQDVTTTPVRQRYYYDALLHQPPPDFFSPQKKRRQKRSRKSRHSNEDDLDGLGGLTSPSAAAAVATAAAINAPEQYVPGGLAASLRDWLVQVKSGGGGGGGGLGVASTATHVGRYIVDETIQEPGMMRIAFGRRKQQRDSGETETSPPVRLLLAGEGRQWTTGQDTGQSEEANSSKQTVVSISHPAWEIALDGQPWIVASDWSMHEEQRSL